MKPKNLSIHVVSQNLSIPDWMSRWVDSVGQEDPFYACDLSDVVSKVDIWKKYLPRVVPFYAVKCNNDRVLLKLLAALGLSFDCASQGEMELILGLGVDPERVIFANPTKLESQMVYARSKGVLVTTFDGEDELKKTLRSFPESHVVLRLRCDAQKAQLLLGDKFGVDEEEASRLLNAVAKMGLNFAGVAFHVGTGCEEAEVYQRGIRASRKIFDDAEALGLRPYFLDIGGGFQGRKGTSIGPVASAVNAALDEFFPESSGRCWSGGRLKVVAEPGRFFCSSAFTLATLVHSRRMLPASGTYFYYVNEGVYGSFAGVVTENSRVLPRVLLRRSKKGKDEGDSRECVVWGPTLDALDVLSTDVPLPVMDVGDWLFFENMGAYSIAIVSNFNMFPPAQVHYLLREDTWADMRVADVYKDCRIVLDDSVHRIIK